MPFGDHERAYVYKGDADYREIIQAEVSGDYIERLPNTQEERWESLVLGEYCLNRNLSGLLTSRSGSI